MTEPVAPVVIDALPPAPQITDTPAVFNAKAFPFVAALDGLRTQTNSSSSAAYQNALSASESAASAEAAAASYGADKWVSGTNYSDGVVVWSPLDRQPYRRNGTGVSTIDPALDSVGWTFLGGQSLAQVYAAVLSF